MSNLGEREIPNYWFGNCFGCSRKNAKGLNLRFWLNDGGCYTRCTIPDYLCGIDGVVHGGIITLVIEEVAEWAIIGHLSKFGRTRDISIRYLKPVPTNTEILVDGRIVKQEEKNILCRSTVRDSSGSLLVESESNWAFASPAALAKVSSLDEHMIKEFLGKYSK